jgi:uncharacterized RmlC-like cupin family protein
MTQQLKSKACKVIEAVGQQSGKQVLNYFQGISAETVGSSQMCMHLINVPVGGRAKVHKHEHHETTIYVLSGEAYTLYGDQLQYVVKSCAGDMVYIPADIPHLPINLGSQPVTGVVARTDPNEQESLILLPELEHAAELAIEKLKQTLQN